MQKSFMDGKKIFNNLHPVPSVLQTFIHMLRLIGMPNQIPHAIPRMVVSHRGHGIVKLPTPFYSLGFLTSSYTIHTV